VSDHLGHDGLPPIVRVLRYHHRDTATEHTVLHKGVALVGRRLGVPGCTQQLPQMMWKSVLVQTRRVHVSVLVDHQQLVHLPNKDKQIS